MSLCDLIKRLVECTVEERRAKSLVAGRSAGGSARRQIIAPGKRDE